MMAFRSALLLLPLVTLPLQGATAAPAEGTCQSFVSGLVSARVERYLLARQDGKDASAALRRAFEYDSKGPEKVAQETVAASITAGCEPVVILRAGDCLDTVFGSEYGQRLMTTRDKFTDVIIDGCVRQTLED